MQTHLVSYDITDDRLRGRAAKRILLAGAYRAQYSVFIGTFSAAGRRRLLRDLKKISQQKAWTVSDSILVLPLHQYSKDTLTVIGEQPEDWALMSGEVHTLII